MNNFRFRAQPALDLRIQQDDVAQKAAADAETRRNSARDARDAAERAIAETLLRANADVARNPADVTMRTWYRNWIVSQRQDLARRERELEVREAELREARRAAIVTRRKRRALERFRERRLHAHEHEERREETRALDELGTLRFALRSRGGHT